MKSTCLVTTRFDTNRCDEMIYLVYEIRDLVNGGKLNVFANESPLQFTVLIL